LTRNLSIPKIGPLIDAGSHTMLKQKTHKPKLTKNAFSPSPATLPNAGANSASLEMEDLTHYKFTSKTIADRIRPLFHTLCNIVFSDASDDDQKNDNKKALALKEIIAFYNSLTDNKSDYCKALVLCFSEYTLVREYSKRGVYSYLCKSNIIALFIELSAELQPQGTFITPDIEGQVYYARFKADLEKIRLINYTLCEHKNINIKTEDRSFYFNLFKKHAERFEKSHIRVLPFVDGLIQQNGQPNRESIQKDLDSTINQVSWIVGHYFNYGQVEHAINKQAYLKSTVDDYKKRYKKDPEMIGSANGAGTLKETYMNAKQIAKIWRYSIL